jgi:serine/threonine protein kinase
VWDSTDDLPELLGGRYDLGEVLGEGGMGVVYRAWDIQLQRYVAIKLLRQFAVGSSARARFGTEAKTLARLSHPGLITLLDASTFGDEPYLVMELVVGQTLVDHSGEVGLGLREVVGIGIELADVLDYVHRQQIVHRDLKPSNVLLRHDGRVKLADFGVARLLDGAVRHTATGMTMGTAAYLSPEQVRGETLTVASDIYSLGLVLLEARSGHPVYQGAHAAVAVARLTSPPPIDAALPRKLRILLTEMTADQPADRPSAAQVAARFRSILTELDDETEALPSQPPTQVRRPGSGRRVLAPLAGVAAAAVLITALLVGSPFGSPFGSRAGTAGQGAERPAPSVSATPAGSGGSGGSLGSGGPGRQVSVQSAPTTSTMSPVATGNSGKSSAPGQAKQKEKKEKKDK